MANSIEEPILPGEETIEQLWREQKGVDLGTGKMWLTPRMERNAKRLVTAWAEWDKLKSK